MDEPQNSVQRSSLRVNDEQQWLADAGIKMVRMWRTRPSQYCCDLCAALNGKTEEHWSARFQSGPPAHESCECFMLLTFEPWFV